MEPYLTHTADPIGWRYLRSLLVHFLATYTYRVPAHRMYTVSTARLQQRVAGVGEQR
jgi:hypothetical protein